MTEDMIERFVSCRTDRLDAAYMRTAMTEAEYKAKLKEIDDWAANELRTASAA